MNVGDAHRPRFEPRQREPSVLAKDSAALGEPALAQPLVDDACPLALDLETDETYVLARLETLDGEPAASGTDFQFDGTARCPQQGTELEPHTFGQTRCIEIAIRFAHEGHLA